MPKTIINWPVTGCGSKWNDYLFLKNFFKMIIKKYLLFQTIIWNIAIWYQVVLIWLGDNVCLFDAYFKFNDFFYYNVSPSIFISAVMEILWWSSCFCTYSWVLISDFLSDIKHDTCRDFTSNFRKWFTLTAMLKYLNHQ